ncbi:hypothetical protein L218DRAFT_1053171 [Marasmius fiardii PR-910]|nr:hypothetical protein L218DRAFT_1053171 [Marasmius fiardii PR-910]
MTTNLSNVPTFPDERRLTGTDNYRAFRDYVISTTTTAPNSTTPTPEEWVQHKGWVAGLQNKFETSTQVLRNIAKKQLEGMKMQEDGNLDMHLQGLAKLRKATNDVGCNINDSKYISTILGSLPPSWVLIVQVHQNKTDVNELTAALMEYWVFTKHNMLASTTASDPTALAAATPHRQPTYQHLPHSNFGVIITYYCYEN